MLSEQSISVISVSTEELSEWFKNLQCCNQEEMKGMYQEVTQVTEKSSSEESTTKLHA